MSSQTNHVIRVFTSDWLNDIIIALRDYGRHDCWQRPRENQSLRFCCASSSFLFFSRLTLSESLLFFTGERSWYFSLHEAFLCTRTLFFFYLSILTGHVLFFFFSFPQVRVFAMWHLVHAVLVRLRTKGKKSWNVYSECKISYNLLIVLLQCTLLICLPKEKFTGIKQTKRIPWVDECFWFVAVDGGRQSSGEDICLGYWCWWSD